MEEGGAGRLLAEGGGEGVGLGRLEGGGRAGLD